METYEELKNKKMKELAKDLWYSLLYGIPRCPPMEKRLYHRALVTAATLEQDIKTGAWVMYGESGIGAWGGNVTDEEAQAFIKSGEFKAI